MGARSVITLTTGPAGSGKTYVRCSRFLCDEWLPERTGIHYSNFPIFREKVAEFVSKRMGKAEENLLERMQIIPTEVMNTWISGQSGPWDFFHNKNLDGCHIAIDECHNFCGAKTHHRVRARWQAWLGEIRHQGATVEFLSQSPEKVAREIHYEAGLRLSLINSEDRRDPFLGILLGDWYELKAAFITGDYQTVVWEVERRNVDGKWVEQNKRMFTLDPRYFELYDSFSRPVQGGEKSHGQPREYQKRSRSALVWWFFKRNAFSIVPRFALVASVVYLCTGGSAPLLNWMVKRFEMAGKSNLPAAMTPEKKNSTVPIAEPKMLPAPMTKLEPEVLARMSALPALPLAEVIRVEEPHRPVIAPTKADTVEKDLKKEINSTSETRKEEFLEKAIENEHPARLALVAKDRIALDDGRIIRVGEPCGTLLVIEVDVRRRECILTGGRRVRMGDKIPTE